MKNKENERIGYKGRMRGKGTSGMGERKGERKGTEWEDKRREGVGTERMRGEEGKGKGKRNDKGGRIQ